jgi:hypothetical protein
MRLAVFARDASWRLRSLVGPMTNCPGRRGDACHVLFVLVVLRIPELRRAGVRSRWCVAAAVMERCDWVG